MPKNMNGTWSSGSPNFRFVTTTVDTVDRDRPPPAVSGALAACARRASDPQTEQTCLARAHRRHGGPRLGRGSPGAAATPQWAVASAHRHGARQPAVAARAWAQVGARRGTDDG